MMRTSATTRYVAPFGSPLADVAVGVERLPMSYERLPVI